MTRRRQGTQYRDLDGLLILDKAKGVSSNQALQQVRKLLRARKAGHCGSLDPMATGVLPICLGEATKFSLYLLDADKAYRASCRLGQTTTTGDAEGEVLTDRAVDVNVAEVQRVLRDFRGEIQQVPPMYSALKHKGKRLYQLAREGKQVERPARPVHIHSLELIALSAPSLEIDVLCSKGTYVRTLAEDIGEALGCGAHLQSLRRTRVGIYDETQAIDYNKLCRLEADEPDSVDKLLLPVAAMLKHFPAQTLDAADGRRICRGQRVKLDAPTSPGLRRLVVDDGQFLGLGEVVADGLLHPKRLINTG